MGYIVAKLLVSVIFITFLLSWGTPRGSSKIQDPWQLIYKNSSNQTISTILTEAEGRTGISADLLRAIIFVESGFNPQATSKKGAQGLMQVMPATARSLGFTPTYDIDQNITTGVHYLASMLERYDGNVSLALAAYNAGPGAVKKYGGIPPYKETQLYIAKVLSLYNFFQGN